MNRQTLQLSFSRPVPCHVLRRFSIVRQPKDSPPFLSPLAVFPNNLTRTHKPLIPTKTRHHTSLTRQNRRRNLYKLLIKLQHLPPPRRNRLNTIPRPQQPAGNRPIRIRVPPNPHH